MPRDLSDTQRVILTTAAARNDLSVIPLAPTISASADAIHREIKALLKADLIREQPASDAAVVWTRREGTDGTMLVVTRKGLAAVGIGDEANAKESSAQPDFAGKRGNSTPRKRGSKKATPSKLSILITHLERPEGATLLELTEATSWQSHSVRGAMSGALRKKRGLDVISEVTQERGRVYRINPTAKSDVVEDGEE